MPLRITILVLRLQVQGDEPEAEVAYRRALELDPSSAAACNNLANVLRELGHLGEAAQLYQRAWILFPGCPSAVEPSAFASASR